VIERLSSWAALYNQRTLRERALLLAVTLAAVLALADLLWLSPAYRQWQAARQQLRSAEIARDTLHSDLKLMARRREADGHNQQKELSLWRAKVRDGELALREHEATLVGPDRMVALLDELLGRHGQVRVRAMRSLGQQDLLHPGADAPAGQAAATNAANAANAASSPGLPPGLAAVGAPAVALPGSGAISNAAAVAGGSLYRHGVELTLEGNYPDLQAYLQAVEALPQHLLWGALTLKADQHPKTVITLRLYTISRDRHWLEI